MADVRVYPPRASGRYRLLLTEDRPHAPEHWTSQLPKVLEPHGWVTFVVRSVHQALRLAEQVRLHAAVIDLAMPLALPDDEPPLPGSIGPPLTPSGLRALELFRRVPHPPPMILVHNAPSQRELDRILREALRQQVFSVVSKPVEIETILQLLHRLMQQTGFQENLDQQETPGLWPESNLPN